MTDGLGNESPGGSPTKGKSFRELAEGARSADPACADALFERYNDSLFRLAEAQFDRRLQRRISPADVVQEALLQAHANLGQFRGFIEEEFVGWLRTIVTNTSAKLVERHLLAACRSLRLEVSLERLGASIDAAAVTIGFERSRLAEPEPAAQRNETALLVMNHLMALPEDDLRDVLICRHMQDMPISAIAEKLNRSESAVRRLLSRAEAALRRALTELRDRVE